MDSHSTENPERENSRAHASYLPLWKKSPPAVLIFIIIAGTILGIIGMQEGYEFDLKKMTVSKPDNASSFTLRELNYMSPDLFAADQSKAQMKATLQSLVKMRESLEKYKLNNSYKILIIESAIVTYGGSIDTRIDSDSRKDEYKVIQEILRDIGHYDGNINGNQMLTHEAVKDFQASCNDKYNSDIFKPEHFGFLGKVTLREIRKAYESKNGS